MPSLYLHIPYCERACSYCDFYFTTNDRSMPDFVYALGKEIETVAPFWSKDVATVYFGGGTPARLPIAQLEYILTCIHQHFSVEKGAEITLEANPNDLNPPYLRELHRLGINRLSIGIQSFIERELLWMNRSHDADQARRCVPLAQDAGFNNISIDLIYDTPFLTDAEWETTLHQAFQLNIQHISAYGLTVEPKTKLAFDVQKGTIPLPDEEQFGRQFVLLHHILESTDMEGYEISNFAYPNYRSVHNSNYWKGLPYLGLGPSAHGYDGTFRYVNESNVHQYIERFSQSAPLLPKGERLTDVEIFNERLMTRLRTMEGYDLAKYPFPPEEAKDKENIIRQFVEAGYMVLKDHHLCLTLQGKIIANHLIEKMMTD